MTTSSDERIAAVLTDRSRFLVRLTKLRNEAAAAGDYDQVRLCDAAKRGDEDAAERCAYVLAEAEAEAEPVSVRYPSE